jgi:glutathione synthase/RimK-type ligase-like ATP-grasp enzyme
MSLLAATLQLPDTTWLSSIGAITRAENKLTQVNVATRAGVRTPRTIVTNDNAQLPGDPGDVVVVKPLGVGHFVENGRAHTVHATAANVSHLTTQDLVVAPFLIQERLLARRHWRVVTVGDEAWSAALDAAGHSLDWRRDPSAHHSFKDECAPSEIKQGALGVTAELNLGYSSQDWIETDDAVYLLDVNPRGQWLFLSDRIGDAVARAIARWLEGGGGQDD